MTFRRGRLALLLATLAMPASVRAQVATDSAGLEPVIVELGIGRYGSRTVPAFRSSGDALIPVLQLAENALKKSSAIFLAVPSIRREPICASLPPTFAFTS